MTLTWQAAEVSQDLKRTAFYQITYLHKYLWYGFIKNNVSKMKLYQGLPGNNQKFLEKSF